MNWFTIALLGSAIQSASFHIDKYLISKYFKGGGLGSILIFSSLIGFLLLPCILLIDSSVLNIERRNALIIILNGIIYITSLIPYIYALEKDDASVVVPLFQTIPIYTYFLGYFVLGETLTITQLMASVLIIVGAVLLTLNLDNKTVKFKYSVFFLMMIASFMIALYGLLFKVVALQENYWTTSFWQYIGFTIVALFLLVFIRPYRIQFLQVFKKNKFTILSINAFNEINNIISNLLTAYATLLAPLTLVYVVGAFQPFFVLAYGLILTFYFPHISQEKIDKKNMAQKLIAILFMFIGVFFLNK